MSNKPKIKNGFYKGFIEGKSLVQEPIPPKDQIVIINKKERDSFLKVVFTALGAAFKFIIYVVVFGLSSIGLTAILNTPTRNLLIEILIQ